MDPLFHYVILNVYCSSYFVTEEVLQLDEKQTCCESQIKEVERAMVFGGDVELVH